MEIDSKPTTANKLEDCSPTSEVEPRSHRPALAVFESRKTKKASDHHGLKASLPTRGSLCNRLLFEKAHEQSHGSLAKRDGLSDQNKALLIETSSTSELRDPGPGPASADESQSLNDSNFTRKIKQKIERNVLFGRRAQPSSHPLNDKRLRFPDSPFQELAIEVPSQEEESFPFATKRLSKLENLSHSLSAKQKGPKAGRDKQSSRGGRDGPSSCEQNGGPKKLSAQPKKDPFPFKQSLRHSEPKRLFEKCLGSAQKRQEKLSFVGGRKATRDNLQLSGTRTEGTLFVNKPLKLVLKGIGDNRGPGLRKQPAASGDIQVSKCVKMSYPAPFNRLGVPAPGNSDSKQRFQRARHANPKQGHAPGGVSELLLKLKSAQGIRGSEGKYKVLASSFVARRLNRPRTPWNNCTQNEDKSLSQSLLQKQQSSRDSSSEQTAGPQRNINIYQSKSKEAQKGSFGCAPGGQFDKGVIIYNNLSKDKEDKGPPGSYDCRLNQTTLGRTDKKDRLPMADQPRVKTKGDRIRLGLIKVRPDNKITAPSKGEQKSLKTLYGMTPPLLPANKKHTECSKLLLRPTVHKFTLFTNTPKNTQASEKFSIRSFVKLRPSEVKEGV